MSEIVKTTIASLTNSKQLKDMYMVDVHQAVMDVFRKMDYTPSKNIEKAVDIAWANADREDYLSDFIYDVWRHDS